MSHAPQGRQEDGLEPVVSQTPFAPRGREEDGLQPVVPCGRQEDGVETVPSHCRQEDGVCYRGACSARQPCRALLKSVGFQESAERNSHIALFES